MFYLLHGFNGLTIQIAAIQQALSKLKYVASDTVKAIDATMLLLHNLPRHSHAVGLPNIQSSRAFT
jgi:hypothetical protein